ncbi:NF038122 family metalloprotease [Paludisphaera borealis]|uniref:PKD domain-containing protein n=1 Tax=Paludisphaera borealis TaxID=1387353 RepID=A0A1U7CJI8_9BACT|nr:NF038122 family metalloprotease [Paludisphaera borealis]APW59101.1 hypothetical protein BSF38_00515 [Paludisphaera borealis]
MALVINATFDSSITNDPNAAAIEGTINRTIAAYENLITDNVTVDITFQEGGGLGGSSGGLLYFIKYADYRSALVSHATTANDNTAIASLPVQTNDPINNNSQIAVRSPLARALGFNAPNAGGAAGDGTITLNTAICNLDRTSVQDASKYDLQAVTAHEIDEILGFGSSLDAANNGTPVPTGMVRPDDLFRYDQNGARSYSSTATDQAYFSIDGGTTDLARFNQTHTAAYAGDYGDWYSFFGGQTPQVQDAFNTPGATANLDAAELTRLDVLGYSLVLNVPQVTAAADQTGVEGAAKAFNLGSFTDPDAAPWGVTVAWGDGSSNTSFFLNSAGSLGSKPHKYAEEGSYTVTVTVNDFTSQTQSKTFQVNVSDPAVIATGRSISAVEGASTGSVVLATFTDPGGPEPIGDYSADVNWGDGSGTQVGAGSIVFNGSTFEVHGVHTYAEESGPEHPGSQPYVITVTIHHESAPMTVVASSATVSDPSVVAVGVPVFAVNCKTITVSPATFTDPGGPESLNDYSASIDWGDGTGSSVGSISYAGGVFTVNGAHAYASHGNYTITTTIDHESSVPSVATSTATIKDDLGLLLLDPTAAGSLLVTGNGNVVVTGCGAVVVDSNAPYYAAVVAQNGKLSASQIHVGGGVSTWGNATINPTADHDAAVPDPLGLGLPTPPSPLFGAVNDTRSVPLTLSPGTYLGGIHVSGNATVTLAPGVYYLKGGGLSVSGNGVVKGSDVLIINVPSGPRDTITLSGLGQLNLTALTSGPYQGVVVLQAPASSNPIRVTENAKLNLTGVAYAAHAAVDISGNGRVTINPGPGTATLPPIDGALIAYDLNVADNGVLTINPDSPSLAMAATPASGSLAASTGAADVHAAAIASLAGDGGARNSSASVSGEIMAQAVLNSMAAPATDLWLTTVPLKSKTSA